jgi:hypothetical protein
MNAPSIKVWCDDPSHPAMRERVFIAEFHKPNVAWMPKPQHHRGHTGVKWWREDGGGLHKEPGGGEWSLTRCEMVCRFCKRPFVLRLGKLDAVLELANKIGRDELTLRQIRAILEKSKEFDPKPVRDIPGD